MRPPAPRAAAPRRPHHRIAQGLASLNGHLFYLLQCSARCSAALEHTPARNMAPFLLRSTLALSAAAVAAAAASAAPVELLPHGDFSAAASHPATAGAPPKNWTVVCANNATCPTFSTGSHLGVSVLTAQGNGRVESYGWIESPTAVALEVGKSYCFNAELDFEGFEDLQRHTRVEINGQGYTGGVFDYHRPAAAGGGEGKKGGGAAGWVTATKQFKYGWPAPMSSSNGTGTVRLYFKYSASGKVMWKKVSLTECPAPAPRKPAKIAAAWWDLPEGELHGCRTSTDRPNVPRGASSPFYFVAT
jgi:hypothetical protein